MFSSDFLDQIYEAAFIPSLWQGLLDEMARRTNAMGTLLHGTTDVRQRSIFSETLNDFMAEAAEWEIVNSRSQLLLTLPHAEFHSDADYFSEEAMKQDWLYRDYLWPHGIGYAAATHIKVPNGDTLILSVERQRENGPFERPEVDALTALRPHLARAAMLASRLQFERIRAANEALQLTGLPAAAITAEGKVLDCNELFSSLPKQIVIRAGDQLHLVNPSANSLLVSALEAIRVSSPTAIASRSFALPGAQASEPAVVHLLPIRGHARDLFSRAALFVVVTPLGKGNVAPAEIIQGLFDLTVTEARIAAAITAGKEPSQIATEFGVSVETVRFHIKSIFAKTGFSRQVDLAATIAGIRRFP